jgi:hypothetical protein
MKPGLGLPTTSSCDDDRLGFPRRTLPSERWCPPLGLERSRTASPGARQCSIPGYGALSISLDDLLAGVIWTPGEIELEIDARYEVTFEVQALDREEGKGG